MSGDDTFNSVRLTVLYCLKHLTLMNQVNCTPCIENRGMVTAPDKEQEVRQHWAFSLVFFFLVGIIYANQRTCQTYLYNILSVALLQHLKPVRVYLYSIYLQAMFWQHFYINVLPASKPVHMLHEVCHQKTDLKDTC